VTVTLGKLIDVTVLVSEWVNTDMKFLRQVHVAQTDTVTSQKFYTHTHIF